MFEKPGLSDKSGTPERFTTQAFGLLNRKSLAQMIKIKAGLSVKIGPREKIGSQVSGTLNRMSSFQIFKAKSLLNERPFNVAHSS